MKPHTFLIAAALAAHVSSCNPRAGADPVLTGPRNWTSSRQIRSMAVWRGSVWATTPGGLLQADPVTGTIVKRTAEQGLPEADLLSIEPAGERMLLIGRRTLAAFDGTRVSTLPAVPNADPAHPPTVAAIGGRVFAAASGALHLLNVDEKTWQPLATPEAPSFLTSSDRRLWMAGPKQVWSSPDGAKWTPQGAAPEESVVSIEAFGSRVAIATRSAVHLHHGKHTRVLPVTGLVGATHLAGITLEGHRLLVAVHGSGLWELDLSRADATLRPVDRPNKGVAPLSSLSQAREAVVVNGEVWLGTSHGLLRRLGTEWKPLTSAAEPPGNVCAALARYQGALWLVTHDGGLGTLRDGHWEPAKGPERSHVLQLASAGGRLWARHPDGTLSFLEAGTWAPFKPAASDRLKWSSTLASGEQGLWIGTWAGATLQCHAAPSSREDYYHVPALEKDPVTAIATRGDELWLASARRGVAVRSKDGQWRAWHEGNGLRDGWITALAADGERMWVGTFNGGLAVWDGKSWSYPDPLPTPSGRKVTSLVVDRHGAVWAGTRAGLARFAQGKWTVFTEADGLAGSEIQCLLPDGDTLWIGTRTGLTHLPLTHSIRREAAHTLTSPSVNHLR